MTNVWRPLPNRAWLACKGADGVCSAASWISILCLFTRKGNLTYYEQYILPFLGGLRILVRVWPSISNTDNSTPSYPLFLTVFSGLVTPESHQVGVEVL